MSLYDDDQKRHRLHNLEVHEVSLVDVPAVPSARYLVTKRDQSPPNTNVNINDYLDTIEKSVTTTSLATGGLLNPEQSERFVRMMTEASVIAREARVVQMRSPKRTIDKIGFLSRAAQAAQEGVEPASDADPTLDKIELSTVEAIISTNTSYSALEDNVERGKLADTITQLLAERMGLDLEEQWVQGDEAGTTGDTFLEQNNGIIALATNSVDGTTLVDRTDALEAFDAAWAALPRRFKKANRKEWRFFVSDEVESQYRQTLSERATAGGDRFVLDDAPVTLRGVPMVPVQEADLPTYDLDGAGAGTAMGSDAILVMPRNIVVGIQRAINIESERRIKARVIDHVCTVRSDLALEEPEGVVIVKGIETAAS